MSDSKFPLCESVGLKPTNFTGHIDIVNGVGFIPASDVEALLAKGKPVAGYVSREGYHFTSIKEISLDTHTALLIGIKPIVRECEQHTPKIASKQVPFSTPETGIMLGCSVVCATCGVPLKAEWSAK